MHFANNFFLTMFWSDLVNQNDDIVLCELKSNKTVHQWQFTDFQIYCTGNLTASVTWSLLSTMHRTEIHLNSMPEAETFKVI